MLDANRPKLQTGGNFEPFPSGKYTLQIADITSVIDTYKGVDQDKFKFMFVILTDKKFKNSEGKEETVYGRRVWHKFSTFISAKSYLHKFIQILDPSILAMTKEQKEAYDLNTLFGKQIDALISKDTSKDGESIYNNIQSFEKCEEELEPFDDLPGNPVIIEKTSVPVTAPEEPAQESADDFLAGMEKENEAIKKEEPKTLGKSAEELEIEEEEKALALRKQKIIDNAKSQVKK